MERIARLILAAFLACSLSVAAQAQGLNGPFSRAVEENLAGALAVFGLSAIPSETASTLFLDTENSSGEETFDFQAGQFGGGFRVAENFPVYLEGFLGWARYDPLLIFSDGVLDAEVPLKWTNVSATGGIGYEFDLSEDWVLRPQFHVALGRVQTDLSVGAQIIANQLGVDVSTLENGGVWAGGVGGSISLAYNKRLDNDWEYDLSLRHTHIALEPIAGDKDLVGNADAITSTLWTRVRQPTGHRAFNRPIRLVYELSGSHLPGDQGTILDTRWLAQVGFGGEVDLEETWVPWVTTTRLVARYTRGESLEGFSIGLAASF